MCGDGVCPPEFQPLRRLTSIGFDATPNVWMVALAGEDAAGAWLGLLSGSHARVVADAGLTAELWSGYADAAGVMRAVGLSLLLKHFARAYEAVWDAVRGCGAFVAALNAETGAGEHLLRALGSAADCVTRDEFMARFPDGFWNFLCSIVSGMNNGGKGRSAGRDVAMTDFVVRTAGVGGSDVNRNELVGTVVGCALHAATQKYTQADAPQLMELGVLDAAVAVIREASGERPCAWVSVCFNDALSLAACVVRALSAHGSNDAQQKAVDALGDIIVCGFGRAMDVAAPFDGASFLSPAGSAVLIPPHSYLSLVWPAHQRLHDTVACGTRASVAPGGFRIGLHIFVPPGACIVLV